MKEIDEEKFTALFDSISAGIDTIDLEFRKMNDSLVTLNQKIRELKRITMNTVSEANRWTDADIADAKAIMQCHPECSMVERDGNGLYAGYVVSISPEYLGDINVFSNDFSVDYEYVEISAELLPSLKQGEKIWLKDILGE